MTSCQACGKLIASGTGEELCRACRLAKQAAEQPAAPPPTSEPAAESPPEERELLCVRCRRHAAIDDSEFCLGCHLELIAALGEAAEEVFRTPPAPPAPPVSSAVSLMSDVADKRDRTATSRIRVAGGVKIK